MGRISNRRAAIVTALALGAAASVVGTFLFPEVGRVLTVVALSCGILAVTVKSL